MGVRLATNATSLASAVTLVTTAETLALTSPGINLLVDNAQLLIFWSLDVSVGASTTTVQVRIRRGSTLTGTVITLAQPWVQAVTAGTTGIFSGVYIDTPGIVAEQQYTLSVVQAAASANGTINDACLAVLCL